MITVSDSAVYSSFGVQFVLLIRWILACVVACSRLSDSGEDVKVKGTQKVGRAGKREKEGRAFNHFFYHPLPPTFGTFEIIRFRLSNW